MQWARVFPHKSYCEAIISAEYYVGQTALDCDFAYYCVLITTTISFLSLFIIQIITINSLPFLIILFDVLTHRSFTDILYI